MNALAERSLRALILAAAVWCAIWLAVPLLFAVLPPSDNIEQMIWAQGLELGYHKHPPLPTWILIGVSQAVPMTAQLTYVLGVVSLLIGGYFLWRLSEALLGRHTAVLVVLATAVIGFYSYRSSIFNHNTVLVPFVYASAWYFHRAVEAGRWHHWVVLGALCAGGVLTKYQFLLLPATFVFIAWRLGKLREWRFVGGALVSTALALALLAPHILWLVQTNFLPFNYASESVMARLGAWGRTEHTLGFLAQQLRYALPAIALLWIAVWLTRRKAVASPEPSHHEGLHPHARLWALALGLMPLVLMVVLALVLGTKARAHCGTTALQFIALPLVLWVRGRQAAIDTRTALMVFLSIQALTVMYFIGGEVAAGREQLEGGRVRAFNPQELGRAIEHDWRSVTQEPLRYVVGTTTLGGFAALYASERPQLLLDGKPQASPWVDVSKLERCGAIYIEPLQPPPGSTIALSGGYTSISYQRKRSGEKQTISWSVVAPEASCSGNLSASVVGGSQE